MVTSFIFYKNMSNFFKMNDFSIILLYNGGRVGENNEKYFKKEL